ncbi:MAG: hypothetical protein ACLS6H_13715 [Clostridium sp.]
MKVITLDAQLEREMVASLSRGKWLISGIKPGNAPACDPQLAEQIKVQWFITEPVILITGYEDPFYHLVEPFYPNIRVLSFNEIANNVQIQSIGNISTMKKGS